MLTCSNNNGEPNISPSTFWCLPKDIPNLPTNLKGLDVKSFQIDYNNNETNFDINNNTFLNSFQFNNLINEVGYFSINSLGVSFLDENGDEKSIELNSKNTEISSYFENLDFRLGKKMLSVNNTELSMRANIYNILKKELSILKKTYAKLVKISKLVVNISFLNYSGNEIKESKLIFNINDNIVELPYDNRIDYGINYVNNGSVACCMVKDGLDIYVFDAENDTWGKI